MADEDVIAEAGEQAPVEDAQPEAEQAAPEETAPVAADGDEQPSDEGTAEPHDETEPSGFDPSSLDDAAWERILAHERISERLKVERNAGSQSREAQLKREAGKKDQTRANVDRFIRENNLEVEDTSRLDYFYDLAAANSAYEIANTLPDVVLRNYQVPPDAREQAVERREAGDWDGYLTTLVSAAADAKVSEMRAEDEKRITTEVNKRVAAEVKARGIEKAPVREGAPPRPSSGGGAGGPTPAEYAAASRQQRDQWRREGVEPVLAQ